MKQDRTKVPGLFLFVALLFFSCSNEVEDNFVSQAAAEKNKYASYFKIQNNGDHSVLTTYLNFEKTDSVVYVLYKEHKPDRNGDAFVKTPANDVACLTSVFVGFLNRLEVLQEIRAVDNIDFICNAQLLYLHAEGSVKELSKSGQLNIEQTLMSGVTTLFVNPGGDKNRDLDKRLLEAKIVPVICADYFEEHPLGRAEWIKVFGLFFGLEKRADSLFAVTEKNYLALKQSTDTCRYKPSVFTELKTNDTWFVAGGKSSLARFFSDAGADYIWKDNGKVNVTALNMEQVVQKALHADFWINLHLANSADDILRADKRYGEFRAFKMGNLFNNNAWQNPKGGNAYWENGLCNPDEILADLVSIFHPNLQAERKLVYYKQLK